MSDKFKIGIIGCGNISAAYIEHSKQFDILEIAALADIDIERAKNKAADFNIPKAGSVDELLADDSIQLVVNLTIPKAHAEVSLKIIEAGKHVYTEKPLATTREDAQSIMKIAKTRNVRIGGAPDTFLGAAHQTARKAIDDGLIGQPVAATAFMMCPGHESWHPNPQFYYELGGGPMFDMGPYYLTNLINLLGPIRRVFGSAAIAISPRTITSEPFNGTSIEVETPDHIAGTIDFANGAIATIITSFAIARHDLPNMQIYGTKGTLIVPDPNNFDGNVKLGLPNEDHWQTLSCNHHTGYGRSAGIADMAHAIRAKRDHRANDKLTFAVVDAMQGFLEAAQTGNAHELIAEKYQPAPVPHNLPRGTYEN